MAYSCNRATILNLGRGEAVLEAADEAKAADEADGRGPGAAAGPEAEAADVADVSNVATLYRWGIWTRLALPPPGIRRGCCCRVPLERVLQSQTTRARTADLHVTCVS